MDPKQFTPDTFIMYYQMQYDRIDKLETKRENFCNYVITISSAVFALGFTSTINNAANFTLLVSFIILINVASIVFIAKSRQFIKMHQKRAKSACEECQHIIIEISNKVGKPNSDSDCFSRSRIYSYIHALIIFLSISSIFTTGYVSVKLQNPKNNLTQQSK